MRQLVDATVAAVLPDAEAEVVDDFDLEGCGSETDDEFFDYMLSVDVPAEEMHSLIARVGARLEELGGNDDDPGPAITYGFEGYSLSVTGFRDHDQVLFAGATDCSPPE